jgi:glycosyltransferase involved in cell wall biosynthesis
MDEVRSRWQVSLLAKTFGFVRRHRQAVLHVHHVWPAGDRYLVPLAHLAGVRAVIVTEHLVGYAHSTSQKWLKRWELSRADAVVGVSRAVTAMLERDYEFDAAAGRVIENGVDAAGLDRSQPRAAEERARVRARLGAGDGAFAWVFVGRLEKQKGLDVLLDAFAKLGEGTRRLWIVGEGSQSEALASQAARLGIADRVRFEGAVVDAAPYLWAADGFALASRWEGLPLALLEAQAAGLPVVAAAAGGVPEAVRDGVTGLLVPREDAIAFAIAMVRVETEDGLAVRLSYEGARQARDEWSWERMVSAYEVLYERAWRSAPEGAREGER